MTLEQQTSLRLWQTRHSQPFYQTLELVPDEPGLIVCDREPVARFANDAEAVRTLVLAGYTFDAVCGWFKSSEQPPREWILNDLLEFDPDKVAGELVAVMQDTKDTVELNFDVTDKNAAVVAAVAAKLKELCLP